MAEKTYRDAIHDALIEEMERDHAVLMMGEDIGVYEGTVRITAGMLKKFGPQRVIDTPIAEAGMVGTAIGMAMLGLRPVVEMMTMNFSIVAADQIVNHAAKIRYFSGVNWTCRWWSADRTVWEFSFPRSTPRVLNPSTVTSRVDLSWRHRPPPTPRDF